MPTLIEDSRYIRIYIVICSGCNVVFPLQILRTPRCFLHASSFLTHCVYVISHLVCAVSLTNNLFTSYHFAPPLTCFTPVLLISLCRMETLPSRLLSVKGT